MRHNLEDGQLKYYGLTRYKAIIYYLGGNSPLSDGQQSSPGKIILGAATAGVESKAGEILKIMLCITLPVVILIGLCLYVMIAIHC